MTRSARPAGYDLLGISAMAALAAWTVVSAIMREANPVPQLATLAIATAAYLSGRAYGGNRPVLVGGAVVAAILVVTVLSGPDAVSGGPLAPPLGYANANGALFTLGVAAAALLALLSNKEYVRRPAGVLIIVLLTLTVATMSKAAALVAIAVVVLVLAAHRLGRWIALAGPLVVVGAIALTVLLAVAPDAMRLAALERGLTERRTVLWREALHMLRDNPLFGIGPGRFAETSPTALSDADAAWAHSAYLQVGAETGFPGLLLVILLLLWTFGALYRAQQDVRMTVIVAAGTTAVAVHAAIDYLAHFPAVIAVAALLAGLASSRQREPATAAGAY